MHYTYILNIKKENIVYVCICKAMPAVINSGLTKSSSCAIQYNRSAKLACKGLLGLSKFKYTSLALQRHMLYFTLCIIGVHRLNKRKHHHKPCKHYYMTIGLSSHCMGVEWNACWIFTEHCLVTACCVSS